MEASQPKPNPYFSPDDLRQWQANLAEADRYNIFCHCHQCGYEWVTSAPEPCRCGSQRVETLTCWQFPDG